ncbi:MAG: O-antigen ligase family protein, partial [Acidobacteriia bacterium]|nr:O-antigen ligase family protein [Terriglobia bacterium]
YQARQELMLSSIAMVGERPWMGFGLGTWATVYPAYARFDDGLRDNQAHNDWAQWAAEGGVPFVMMIAWWAGCVGRPAWRSVWGVGVLIVLVHCLLEYHFQQRAAFGYFYFAMAGGVLAEKED